MMFSDFCTLLLACAIFALVQQLARAEGDRPGDEVNLPPPQNPSNAGVANQGPRVRSDPPRCATPGPSAPRSALVVPAAGPSMPPAPASRALVDAGDGPSSASSSAGVGPSLPWTPKRGWSSTYRLAGVGYFRFEKRMQPRRSTNPDADEPAPVLTPYWVADKIGTVLPLSPPNLSGDPKLRLGDVFIFHTATQHRLWIWDEVEGRRFWKRVSEGYQKADGKCLLVTEVKREPSWVTKEHFERSTLNRLITQFAIPRA